MKVQGACCAYQASLATDSSTGHVYAAWYSNARGGYGPSGGPERVGHGVRGGAE